jgi:hypothetical protein
VIKNELFVFFARVANPTGGLFTKFEVKVPTVLFGQLFGVITQAGTVSLVISVMKYIWSTRIESAQLAVLAHFT